MRGTSRIVGIVSIGLALGCGGTTTPSPGQVMLVLETNGGVGTTLDFAKVDVVVTDDRAKGQLVKSYALSPAQLPGTVALVAAGRSAVTTKVEVFATDSRGVLRGYKAARITIPTEGAGMLRMKLDVACDGVVPSVSCPGGATTCASSPRVACKAEHACLEGRCIPILEFGARELPAFDAARASSCEPEPEARICARRGVACGSYVLTDTCGTPRIARCGACAGEDSATTAKASGGGLDDCGELGAESCARSSKVPGGRFFRGDDENYPATIHEFRLDAYEVTVGRFRKFVDAWVGGWRPTPRSGKHAHLNGGAGLANAGGGWEAGWDASWTPYVGAPSASAVAPSGGGATTLAAWTTSLSCGAAYTTWANQPTANENRPQNCLSWYDAYAFCIWDGGFLPSEAEWEYAAAGGGEERTYPWGATGPSANASVAVYGCYYNDTGSCSGIIDIAPVGGVPGGAGKWNQHDLGGNVWEWGLDWYETPYASRCDDCTNTTPDSFRVMRGGAFDSRAATLLAAARSGSGPAVRATNVGGRCARKP